VLTLVACAPNGAAPTVGVARAAEVAPELSDELEAASEQFERELGTSPWRSRSVGASAPSTTPTTVVATTVAEPAAMPESVAVIGDSIALSAQEILTASLESLGIDVVAFDALESRRMVSGGAGLPSGASAIDDVLDTGVSPELWIIALGTNDVGARNRPESTAADIATIVDLLPADAHVLWVDTWVRDLDDEAVTLNGLLRLVLAARPNTVVVDWHARGAVDGLIIDDGVHLSPTGKVEFARTITDTLRTTYQRS
jgi:lysophospholipase L1-like esterase